MPDETVAKSLWTRMREAVRPTSPPTVQTLRQEVARLQAALRSLDDQRASLALAAVHDADAAARYQAVEEERRALQHRLEIVQTALPEAERQAADAARDAAVRQHAQAVATFEALTTATQQWVEALLAQLPDAAVLTEARNKRDALRDAAHAVLRGAGAGPTPLNLRRVFNPLDVLHHELDRRCRAIVRHRTGAGPVLLPTADRPHVALPVEQEHTA